MKNLKKIIALVLVCIMAFSALQISASAASTSYAESIEFAIDTLEQAGSGIPIATILIGILYAFFPILIVIDLISYLVSGNAIIAGGFLNLI